MKEYTLEDIAPIKQGECPKNDHIWLLNLDMIESDTGDIVGYEYVDFDKIGNSTVSFDTTNVLYSKLRPYLNKVVIPNRPGYATSEIVVLKPNPEIITREYLAYFLRSSHFVKYINSKTTGAKMPRANIKVLKQAKVLCPNLDTQNQIVKILQKCTKIINARKKELMILDELVKARFVEMFGEQQPSSNLSDYIHELRSGKSLAGSEVCKNKVLKTGAATFGWFDPKQYKYLPDDYQPRPEHRVETGDLIISRMNTPNLVGACSFVFKAPEDMYYPDRLWKVIPTQRTNLIFLWQLLWDSEVRKQIKEKSSGTSGTMHNISKARLLEVKCIDVSLELQNQYANFVLQVVKSKFTIDSCIIIIRKALQSGYHYVWGICHDQF